MAAQSLPDRLKAKFGAKISGSNLQAIDPWIEVTPAGLIEVCQYLKTEPDLKIGDDLLLDINGRELSWRIVGIAQVLFVDRQVYANYDYLARATNNVSQSSTVVVVTAQHDAANTTRSENAKSFHPMTK